MYNGPDAGGVRLPVLYFLKVWLIYFQRPDQTHRHSCGIHPFADTNPRLADARTAMISTHVILILRSRVSLSDDRDETIEATATTDSGSSPSEEKQAGSSRSTGGSPADLNNYEQLPTTTVNDGDDSIPVGGDDVRIDAQLATYGSRMDGTRAEGEGEGGGEEEPGIFGRSGLLAIPHVKVILLLAVVLQVCV